MTYCDRCEKAFQDNRNVCTEVDNEFHITVDESEMFIDEWPGGIEEEPEDLVSLGVSAQGILNSVE